MRTRQDVAAAVVFLGLMLAASSAGAQDKAQGAPDKAQIERGMKVYAVQKCHVCHSIGDKGQKKGPLDDVGLRLTEEELRLWLVDARGMTKKTKSTRKPFMKNYTHLPKEDIDALVAYMASLKNKKS
jgi:mono/diheme cytochrome c family protein